MTDSDADLLKRFARGETGSFDPVVKRHLGLVYSVAFRTVRSRQLAEEVAQRAFLDLAEAARAGKLRPPISAWLYVVARRAAIDAIRREERIHAREAAAAELSAMEDNQPDWATIEPVLDEAMLALTPPERESIALRFFENRSLAEVGAALGISGKAAHKRIDRALESLREEFGRRGVPVRSGLLATQLSAGALLAAPPSLVPAISALVAAKPALALTSVIAMTAFQKLVLTGTAVVVLAGGIHQQLTIHEQQREIADLRTELQRAERRPRGNGVASPTQSETPKVATIPSTIATAAATTEPEPIDNPAVTQLRKLAGQFTEYTIPEFELLQEKDWATVAADGPLDTEEGQRRALSDLRRIAKRERLGPILTEALKSWLAANPGEMPRQTSDFAPYFGMPISDAILVRYEVLQAASEQARALMLKGELPVIVELGVVDDLRDTQIAISVSGPTYTEGPRIGLVVRSAIFKWQMANPGRALTEANIEEIQQFVAPADLAEFQAMRSRK